MGKMFLELLAARRRVLALETTITELQATIKALEAEQEQPPKPEIELLGVGGGVVQREVTGMGLKLMYPNLLDGWNAYYYTNDEGWAEIFNYIYCVFDMPPYLAQRMDCEDFAFLLKGLVSALFGLNYFAFIIGDSPGGKHAFNLFRTDTGQLLFEPQLGTFFSIGDKGYKPEWALL